MNDMTYKARKINYESNNLYLWLSYGYNKCIAKTHYEVLVKVTVF